MRIHKEFGITLELVKVNPDELIADNCEFEYMDKVDYLAVWAMHNNKTVPLLVFNDKKIHCEDDLFRILQEG